MSQIFSPRSNTIARGSLLAVPIVLIVLVGLLVWWLHSPTFNRVGVTVPQPVAFPHSTHVGPVGLDCRFCHSTVDKSSFADIPPTQTCMGCHTYVRTDSPLLIPVRQSWETGQPIAWNRVHNMPDYVYFNHAAHVNNGVGCESCHGRVDTMTTAVKAETMYMAWCLDCHENPEQNLRPSDQIYRMGYRPVEDQRVLGARLAEEYDIPSSEQLMNCSTCHR